MTTTTEMAESILRKIPSVDGYLALYDDEACIDGWVSNLTEEEVAYLRSLGWGSDSDD